MSFDWEAIGVVGSLASGAILWVYRSLNAGLDNKIEGHMGPYRKNDTELQTEVKLLQQKTDQLGAEVREIKDDVKFLVRRSMNGSVPVPPRHEGTD